MDGSDRKEKKRILFLAAGNRHIEIFFMPVGEELARKGYEVRYLCGMREYEQPRDPVRFRNLVWWENLERLIEETDSFEPDILCIWNGSHPLYRAALLRYLHRYRHLPQVFSELGWFSQDDSIYFDWCGVNGASDLSRISIGPGDLLDTSEEFNLDVFRNRFLDEHLRDSSEVNERDFLFVPLQLKDDTNIVAFSTVFKSMLELVRFLSEFFKDDLLVCKVHPLNQEPLDELADLPNVHLVRGGNLYSYLSKARAVMGLNSTVLVEALMCRKVVAVLGRGILTNKGAFVLDCSNDLSNLRMLADFEPDFDLGDAFLARLIHNYQISYSKPDIEQMRRNVVLVSTGMFEDVNHRAPLAGERRKLLRELTRRDTSRMGNGN